MVWSILRVLLRREGLLIQLQLLLLKGILQGLSSSKTGVINSSVTITATSAVVIMCTITIKQPANGNIEALYNGVTYSSSFTVPYGSSVTFHLYA